MSSFLKTIITLLLLSVFLIGCTMRTEKDAIVHAKVLLEKGELRKVEQLAGKILQLGKLDEKIRYEIDSLLEIAHRIRIDFTLSDTTVLRKLEYYQPTANHDELLRLEKENKLDFLTIDGEKKYFKNCVGNVIRLDSLYATLKIQKEGPITDSLSIFRLAHTAKILDLTSTPAKTVNPVRMKLIYTLRVDADAVPEGETIRCWMPYPRESNERQNEVKLISSDPAVCQVAPAKDLQRAIYLEKVAVAKKTTIFQTEIEFTSSAQSFQLTPEMLKPYQKETLFYKEFTAERPPQIVFSNQIKTLVKYILAGETNPLLQVGKIYKWINDSVTWASALEYSIIPDIPGFVLNKRHGDCGMQTLLFMTMARSVGIPVKWQSGWMLHPGEVNLHDWCEVYYEGIGWVPLDQSFGLQNSPDKNIRDFYTTGIDAYRLIVNDDFSRPLTPSKKFLRSEPYDFQRGEVEWKGGNLYFDKWDWHMEVTYE
jgi:hypothetical protein